MAQSVIMAVGTTKATSTDVVIASGETATIGIYSAAPSATPVGLIFRITQDTPGADNAIANLDNETRVAIVSGPGTFRVTRPAYTGTAFGVFLES